MTEYDPIRNNSKLPFGAVPAGTVVKFRVTASFSDALTSGVLNVFDENVASCGEAELIWTDCESGTETWETEYLFPKAGLFFYNFTVSTDEGSETLGCGTGQRCEKEGSLWQQTVYEADMTSPRGFEGGIIYQIFPDRFFEGKGVAQCPFTDRKFINDKRKTPEYTDLDANISAKSADYYGGNLNGIIEKLPYISSLGVTSIYLNPIFEAHSNHRYNTADYMKIDPTLGTEADFSRLCKKAAELGIKIILDGVFSHTGSDSLYFNAEKRYDSVGAANSRSSSYFSWYTFTNWPDSYECWWNVETLPDTVETDPSFSEFITGENGVIRKWLRLGASGWRLDVADELPETFIEKIRTAAKTENPNAFIIGEVWENASNKISYGERRHYLLGRELDSVMNYPVANAIIDFVKGGPAEALADCLTSVYSDYPKAVCDRLMNHLGTHDTARLITRLAGSGFDGRSREFQAGYQLSAAQCERGKKLVKQASAICWTLYGIPCLYYGDEIGMQGCSDPFNRYYFDWENEDAQLLDHYKALGKFRKENPMLADAAFRILEAHDGLIAFLREKDGRTILCAANSGHRKEVLGLGHGYEPSGPKLSGGCDENCGHIELESGGYCIIQLIKKTGEKR